MWVYMYLLIHLREVRHPPTHSPTVPIMDAEKTTPLSVVVSAPAQVEDKTTLNGVESYVWNKAVLSDVDPRPPSHTPHAPPPTCPFRFAVKNLFTKDASSLVRPSLRTRVRRLALPE